MTVITIPLAGDAPKPTTITAKDAGGGGRDDERRGVEQVGQRGTSGKMWKLNDEPFALL